MPPPSPATAVRRLPAGSYWIGNDSTPNACPRHARRLVTDVWIDRDLLPWRAYEAFITAGGYVDPAWWRTAAGEPFPESARHASVDDRCESIRRMTLADAPASWRRARSDLPVLGLTWFEAAAICHFFNARLPFEAEWEAAQSTKLLQPEEDLPVPAAQEWCLDGYASRYWRADSGVRGRAWHAGQQVTLRGHHHGEPTLGVTARRSADPATGQAGRGFRRVWERDPTA